MRRQGSVDDVSETLPMECVDTVDAPTYPEQESQTRIDELRCLSDSGEPKVPTNVDYMRHH